MYYLSLTVASAILFAILQRELLSYSFCLMHARPDFCNDIANDYSACCMRELINLQNIELPLNQDQTLGTTVAAAARMVSSKSNPTLMRQIVAANI